MASKRKLTKEQKDKRSFRASQKWKDFRHFKNIEQGGLDPITGAKLGKTAHLHHKDLNAEEYQNLDDESKFIMLQYNTHKVVHWCLTYIRKYHSMEVIDRLYEEVKREGVLNGFIEEDDD